MEEFDVGEEARSDVPKRTPPYISFKTLLTFLEDQKEHGLPTEIDRSVLTRFSGSVGGQLIAALKFLGLIDENQSVQDDLLTLVNALGSDQWTIALGALVRKAYAPIVAEDLARLTPAKFHDVFKTHYPAKDAVVRKCEVFFLKAAEAAEISVNPRIAKHRAPRAPSQSRRQSNHTNSGKQGDDRGGKGGATDPPNREPPAPISNYGQLILMLDPERMEEGEQEAVWTLIRYLKRIEAED